MHKRKIAVLMAIGLFVLATFCTVSFAQNQTQALTEAAKNGDLEQLRDLLDEGADINARNKYGVTALMAAAESGNLDVVKFLIEKGADVHARNEGGMTALIWASFNGHAEIVKDLLDKGADIDATTRSGLTAIIVASLRNHPEVVKLLKAHGAKETDKSKSLSDADIWGIAVLLCVSFALILSGKIAKAQGTDSDFESYLGIAVWSAAMMLTMGDDPVFLPVLGCGFVFFAVSDLVALIFSRRQVVHPSVRVHRLYRGGRIAGPITYIGGFLLILFLIYVIPAGFFHSFGRILQWGLWAVALVIWFILGLLERIEICGNGLWEESTLQPWDEFRAFSWTGETEDGLELRLDQKNVVLAEKRLLVRPQDREAVQQLLEAKLRSSYPVSSTNASATKVTA